MATSTHSASVPAWFLAASEAAEKTIGWLDLTARLVATGKPNKARKCLRAIGAFAADEAGLYAALEAAREAVAATSGNPPLHLDGPTGPRHFVSAHDAVGHIWSLASLYADTDTLLRPDLCEWLGINVSQLRAHLLQERARLLSARPAKSTRPLVLRPAATSAAPKPAANKQHEGNAPKLPLEVRAIALFYDRSHLTKKQMAEILGCNEKSLAPKRCPKLAAAMQAYKGNPPPRGHTTREGDVEAYDE